LKFNSTIDPDCDVPVTMTEKQLRERDAKRDLGAELLQSIREMKAGKGRVVAKIEVPPVVMARMKSGLSQSDSQA
jgi:putative transcriptional regulator